MITAHVNEVAILLRFDAPSDNLPRDEWEKLLDELKSSYIPSFYQYGKRMHVDVSEPRKMRAVIYLTDDTVAMDEAIAILELRNISVAGDLRPPLDGSSIRN